MRHLARTLLVGLACLLLVADPAAAGKSSRSEAQTSTRELKRQANQAAARYADTRGQAARLDNEIAGLERQVQDIHERMAPLRAAVTRRVVAVYTSARGLDALTELGSRGDLVKSARGARLAVHASAAELDSMRELAASAAQLRDRQEDLTVKRQEQEEALAKLEDERRLVELKLALMARERKDLQSRLVRAPRASRGAVRFEVPERPVLAQAASHIPVATSFICPIRGPVAYSDSWGDARPGGRRHKGTDLMSPHGTDNVAVVAGDMKRHHSGAGGLSIYLYGDDGNTYYYAHLSEVLGPDRRVAQGEVIGKTGNSGNARGASPHTHFEVHPGGGAAINPYPTIAAHC